MNLTVKNDKNSTSDFFFFSLSLSTDDSICQRDFLLASLLSSYKKKEERKKNVLREAQTHIFKKRTTC
jgi:hypothetical protein